MSWNRYHFCASAPWRRCLCPATVSVGSSFASSSSGRTRDLDCAILDNGQPRHVRDAAAALAKGSAAGPFRAGSCVIAPHFGKQSRELCVEQGLGYVDYDGNCRLVFDDVYIERTNPKRARMARRALRSIFSPKAARVLHVLLRDPAREWRVKDLARLAGVSVGQVSNVRRWLIDQEWAAAGAGGFRLTDPVELLQDWRDVYESLAGTRQNFRTTLSGAALRDAVAEALRRANAKGVAMLAGFAAAQWHEPVASIRREFAYPDKVAFYADAAGLVELRRGLALEPVARDENVVVVHPKNPDVFALTAEPAPGIVCTNAVLTFLDLATPQAARKMAERITVGAEPDAPAGRTE